MLLHGIWMRPLVLQTLARRLRQAGYLVKVPAYASVSLTPAQNAERLYWFIQRLSTDYLHLVAHSLGGIVALHLLSQHPELPPGRLVTLGTPIQGSKIARMIKPLPLLGLAFGNSMDAGLAGVNIPTNIGREWGAIIGTLPLGLGSPFLLGEPNDGAVSVAEAYHPAQTVRIQQRVSHTGMLFSPLTCSYIQHFLRTGQFI
ncbi:lipase family alpha/beta hydrolase [Thiothrix caldifontis]|nr:alpha/beta fold hydrolase [Thiothrix caldifontis]